MRYAACILRTLDVVVLHEHVQMKTSCLRHDSLDGPGLAGPIEAEC